MNFSWVRIGLMQENRLQETNPTKFSANTLTLQYYTILPVHITVESDMNIKTYLTFPSRMVGYCSLGGTATGDSSAQRPSTLSCRDKTWGKLDF